MSSNERPLPRRCVHTVKSAKDFINYLLPSGNHWGHANRGDLAYRGQASSSWKLVPKAFRHGERIGFGASAPKSNTTSVTLQARAEFQAVRQFVKAADDAGLQVASGGARILLDEPKRIFDDRNWEYDWPQPVMWEVLAPAQHHGVPTRLLDVTDDPLVAAFFASSFAFHSLKLRERPKGYLAVWVIDLRFIRALNQIDSRYLERIAEIRVPRANNSYLQAQFAFFLIDRGVNDTLARGELSSIDTVIIDRARFWHTGNRLKGKLIKPTWFHKFPIMKVRLHVAHSTELLHELENRGVTKACIMPSLDRVVESLELQRDTR